LIRLIVIGVVIVVALKVFVTWFEPRAVFFPLRGEDETPARLGIRHQALRLRASDGVEFAAWQLEPDSPKADIVYFHGNGGNLSLWLPVFATLHSFGYRVLAIDYRGYGVSDGTPSEAGIYRDAEAAAAHASSMRNPKRPLIYWGRSLGGPVAAAAARAVPPDALILESTFPDKASVIRGNPIMRALNVFSSYRLNTLDLLRGFSKPVLVVHAERDTIIPFRLGRELFERLAVQNKIFVTLKQGDHNDLYDEKITNYWKPIHEFIDAL
jgi:fermentation-respiration switch protein FrsA (DUF1100 family)